MAAMKMAKMASMKMMAKKKTVKKTGKKWQVFSGSKVKTVGGLTKSDLIRNKSGKVVSKKASLRASKNKSIAKWGSAVKAARKQLGVKGFCAVGGKSKLGLALLAKTRSLYKK